MYSMPHEVVWGEDLQVQFSEKLCWGVMASQYGATREATKVSCNLKHSIDLSGHLSDVSPGH